MFENEVDHELALAKKRGRMILLGGSIAVVLLAAIIIMLAKSKPHQAAALEDALRAGNAEFEDYKSKVEIDIQPEDKRTYPNLIGMFQIEVRANITNRGDRPITGLELVGKMFDMGDSTISERSSIPIPRARQNPLNPGESMRVSIKIDAPSKITEDEVKDVTIELKGLQFK